MVSLQEYLDSVASGRPLFEFESVRCANEGCDHKATHPSPMGDVCEDCYFDLLGELIENRKDKKDM